MAHRVADNDHGQLPAPGRSEAHVLGRTGRLSAPRRRFLIIHNVIAGMRRRWLLRQVCRALEGAGAELTIIAADSFEADRTLAASAVASGNYDAVVAAGGDSTVRGVGAGLSGSDLPLGIIPIGTGNVIAEEIRFRSGPRTIAHNLMHGPSVPVYAGIANGAPFFAMAGAGFDARVLTRLDTAWKRRLGKLAYALPLSLELARKPRVFEAVIDGQVHSCSWLIVAKTACYGGPFRLTRRGSLYSDGFHAVIVRARTRASLASVVLAIALGRAKNHPDVSVIPCQHIFIPREPMVLTQLDGEAVGTTPMEIAPAKEALTIIMPA